jgi:hypothetical protein
MTKAELEEKLLQLPEKDQADLLGVLQERLFGPAPIYDWQRELLDEALEDLRQNPDAGIPVEEALAQARARIARGA